MKKKQLKLLLAIASFLFTVLTGLLVNAISDVTDNFEVKERLKLLKSDVKATESSPTLIDTLEIETEDQICIETLKNEIRGKKVYLGVFDYSNKTFNRELSYGFLNAYKSGNNKLLPRKYRNFNSLRGALSKGNDDFLFLLILMEDPLIRKSAEVSNNAVFKDTEYMSVSLDVEVLLFEDNIDDFIHYCPISEYGFGKNGTWKDDAFSRIISNFEK